MTNERFYRTINHNRQGEDTNLIDVPKEILDTLKSRNFNLVRPFSKNIPLKTMNTTYDKDRKSIKLGTPAEFSATIRTDNYFYTKNSGANGNIYFNP